MNEEVCYLILEKASVWDEILLLSVHQAITTQPSAAAPGASVGVEEASSLPARPLVQSDGSVGLEGCEAVCAGSTPRGSSTGECPSGGRGQGEN